MIDLDTAILIVGIGANAALGAVVWRRQRESMGARLFLVMVSLILLWTIANFAIDASTTGTGALLWTRCLYVFATGFIYAFFLFARGFSTIPPLRLGIVPQGITLAALGVVLVTLGTDLVFSGAAVGMPGLMSLTFGPLYLPINLFGLCMVGIALTELAYKALRAGRTIVRDQAILIIAGWVTFLGFVIVFAALLPYFVPALVNSSKIAPLFSIIMVGCTAYSIVRHQFLDITLIIRRGLIYSMVLGTVLGFYLALLLVLDYLFGIASDTAAFLSGAVTVITGIYGAPLIEAYFRKQTDQIFFKDTYEYSAALEELCDVLNSSVRVPNLIAQSLSVLSRILKPERIEFAYVKTGMQYNQNGIPISAAESVLPGEDGLIIPVCSENKVLGQFLLWSKRSGDPYTAEDRSLLRTFASQSTVALEKAELYEQLKEYSDDLERKVLDRTQHLEDLRTSQRGFMDDISHALQTPLTVLISTMELVTKDMPQEKNRYMRLATRSMDELSRLIRNLLALARIEALPEDAATSRFNLSSTVENLTEYVGVICTGRGITLTADISPSIYMQGNQAHIEEALTNLLSNSVRYTASCPVRNIYVRLARNGSNTEISIKDTGIGINEDRLPHIFERFYRAQDTQGSGLGLAITKQIVERHAGTISASSSFGNGTTMVMRFPSP